MDLRTKTRPFPFPKVDSLPFNDAEDLSTSSGSPHLLSGDADRGIFQGNLMRRCNFTVFKALMLSRSHHTAAIALIII